MSNARKVIVVSSPVTERYVRPGMEGELNADGTQVRVSGCWWTFDDRWQVTQPKSYAVFACPIGEDQTGIHVTTVEDCRMRIVGHRAGTAPIYLLVAGILYDNEQQHYPTLDGETLFDYATRMTTDPAIQFDISNPFQP